MVQVHIDDELHARLKIFVENNRLDYPTIKYAINQAVKEFLERHQPPTPTPARDACVKAEVEV